MKIGGVVLASFLSGCAVTEEPRVSFVRIAELEIDPARLGSKTIASGRRLMPHDAAGLDVVKAQIAVFLNLDRVAPIGRDGDREETVGASIAGRAPDERTRRERPAVHAPIVARVKYGAAIGCERDGPRTLEKSRGKMGERGISREGWRLVLLAR
ncbi:hypothetical protein [Polyangium sp. 15x6]|uniref:hypothetical protein n=1 Tax=Polyangium sp. 15x6 TaxID=3042687 RepID=UPI00249ABCB1|nr:hypothetical protein [Polyangium sp. 15x6]MDI3291723.1 hypothetical protein [Polyangium sp. 15x6]